MNNDWQSDIDGIIPISADPSRGRHRGFNPPLRLALALHKRYRLPLYWREVHRRATGSSQTGLTLRARQENLKGVFTLRVAKDRQTFQNRRLLVIDDIWTTGSTIREFSRFLTRDLGVAEVHALTLARR